MSDIIPVFLGADLNCYNFARAFHEAYGVESYAYGRYPMAPTKYSKIIHFTTVPDMDNEDTMLRILHEFAAQHKGKRLYLFGCPADYAAMIIRRKAELTEYIAPGPAADLYGSIQKKAEFYEVCEKFGIPYPDFHVRISEEGEIQIQGPAVFPRYHKNAEATADTFTEDGWFMTGDLGRLDEEGFLYITGRKKDLIITAGGKNVAPRPIEEVIQRCEFVSQALVLGDKRPFISALVTLDEE